MPPPENKRPFGMRMRWIVWRGEAKNVKFEPDIMPDRVYGKPATLPTKVTFSAPGTYRLRAIATDGVKPVSESGSTSFSVHAPFTPREAYVRCPPPLL